jgi:hypothetical protein
VNAHALYSSLRNLPEFSGSDLNIEGATRVGDVLRLFHRNNGAPRGDLQPVNASCDLNWDHFMDYLSGSSTVAPIPFNICQYELGQLGGVSLGFTDATCADSHLFSVDPLNILQMQHQMGLSLAPLLASFLLMELVDGSRCHEATMVCLLAKLKDWLFYLEVMKVTPLLTETQPTFLPICCSWNFGVFCHNI